MSSLLSLNHLTYTDLLENYDGICETSGTSLSVSLNFLLDIFQFSKNQLIILIKPLGIHTDWRNTHFMQFV
jgi:hypothetical protein